MKATAIIIEFWSYESTGVELPTDIWIHGTTTAGERVLSRMSPAYPSRLVQIEHAERLAKMLGLELIVKNSVIAKEIAP